MATTKKAAEVAAVETTEPAVYDPWSDRRDVYVPRENGQSSMFVAINGRTFNVPCGRTVSVPAPVAEVIEHRLEMLEHAEAVREGLRNQ